MCSYRCILNVLQLYYKVVYTAERTVDKLNFRSAGIPFTETANPAPLLWKRQPRSADIRLHAHFVGRACSPNNGPAALLGHRGDSCFRFHS